jgi:hypothetical protein
VIIFEDDHALTGAAGKSNGPVHAAVSMKPGGSCGRVKKLGGHDESLIKAMIKGGGFFLEGSIR